MRARLRAAPQAMEATVNAITLAMYTRLRPWRAASIAMIGMMITLARM